MTSKTEQYMEIKFEWENILMTRSTTYSSSLFLHLIRAVFAKPYFFKGTSETIAGVREEPSPI